MRRDRNEGEIINKDNLSKFDGSIELSKLKGLNNPHLGERMYYADWMRTTAVYLVIFIHCLNNAADTVQLDDRDAQEKKDGICKCMA